MLIFCEECGQRLDLRGEHVHSDSRSRRFRCDGCGEALSVCKDVHTAALDSPEEVENQRGNGSISIAEQGPLPGVLVVDDSSMIRKVLKSILETGKRVRVIGEASNGAEALELIPKLNPDAVTLDVNMPVMDGLTTLKHMMIKNPRPAVMISTLTIEGAKITFDALKYGAVDFIPKPSQIGGQLERQKQDIVRKVSLAARMETGVIRLARPPANMGNPRVSEMKLPGQIFCIGAAEGGYGSLIKIVTGLRPDLASAVLIVLYAEPAHIDAFARYLGEHSQIKVRRAKNMGVLLGGYCYLASGEEYLTLDKHDSRLILRLNPNPFPGRRGAINMLMMSAAEMFGPKSIGAVLSGSGEDGLEGLREIARQGGFVVVQAPRTCMCKDMALAAIGNLKVGRVIPDYEMAAEFNGFLD